MKTQTFLTRALPLLANVKNIGVFNNVVAGMAGGLIADLRAAAAEDRIVVSDLENALRGIAAATQFEPQQAAIAEAHAQADALLGAIVGGTWTPAEMVLSNTRELVSRILAEASPMRDVFAIQPQKARTIRSAAAELNSIINAEVADGLRPANDSEIAERLFDGADGLEEDSYTVRAAALDAVLANAGKLAKAA